MLGLLVEWPIGHHLQHFTDRYLSNNLHSNNPGTRLLQFIVMIVMCKLTCIEELSHEQRVYAFGIPTSI